MVVWLTAAAAAAVAAGRGRSPILVGGEGEMAGGGRGEGVWRWVTKAEQYRDSGEGWRRGQGVEAGRHERRDGQRILAAKRGHSEGRSRGCDARNGGTGSASQIVFEWHRLGTIVHPESVLSTILNGTTILGRRRDPARDGAPTRTRRGWRAGRLATGGRPRASSALGRGGGARQGRRQGAGRPFVFPRSPPRPQPVPCAPRSLSLSPSPRRFPPPRH